VQVHVHVQIYTRKDIDRCMETLQGDVCTCTNTTLHEHKV